MSGALLLVSILSVPLFILTVLPLGWLKSRSIYLTAATIVSIISGGLALTVAIIAANAPDCSGVTQARAGYPMILWPGFTATLIGIGYGLRLKSAK